MKFELNDYKRVLTDEEILDDIKRVALGFKTDYISIRTYKKNGKYSQTAIQAHFGTWKSACSLAGLRTERTSEELKLIGDEDYLSDLRRVALITNSSTITYAVYQQYGYYRAEVIIKRFGKWDTALKRAGLEGTGLAKQRISEQQCFDEIERIWTLLGRQPTATDIIKGTISIYSIDTFKRRFGGWRKALEAFVQYISSTDRDIQTQEVEKNNLILETDERTDTIKQEAIKTVSSSELTQTTIHRTPRTINTRLRFMVLQRDNFKCCACGASPAKDSSVSLHVDHIIPWSKGGETELGNLQTLCSKCNLGKSDVL